MLRASLAILLMMTLVTGLGYPLLVTLAAQVVFPSKANGSMEYDGERLIGSSLIGRAFEGPEYFWSRPSATVPFPYNAASSSGSNYGPSHTELRKATEVRRKALREADPGNELMIPADLLTASASGLDPDISPEAAYYQVSRVARVRGMEVSRVRALVDTHIVGRQLGIFGEPRVNVTALNRALDGE